MIELRDMELLVALARHGHFARAAREVGLSQPALSMRIRKLEDRLGVTVVRRGNRFLGFTEEGTAMVARARSILAEAKAMEAEALSARGTVSGLLVLGVVPTALASAAEVSLRMQAAFPGVLMRIESATSLAIQQGLEDGTIAAGITYADGTSPDLHHTLPLYDERYALLAPAGLVPEGATSLTWAEAAALPLSLLEPQMQNRRILDRTFSDAGAQPRVVFETNAFTTSIIQAKTGRAVTILPQVLIDALGHDPATRVLTLTDPEVTKSICLVSPNRTPVLPQVAALRRLLKQEHDKLG